jgi:pentatricopeptide repeat protein
VLRRRCATAVSLFRELQKSGLGLDAIALGAGVHALIGANRRYDAKRILLKSRRAGIPVGTNVYNIYLRELSESRDLEGLQRKLSRMTARGIPKNHVTHGTVVTAYVRARRFDLAEAALQQAGSAAGVEAYGALVNGYAREKQFDFARGVIGQMVIDGVPPNKIVYHDLMHQLVLDDNLREALQVARDMQKAGIPLEICHYDTMFMGLGRAGKFSRALALLREMRARGTPAEITSFNILLDAATRTDPSRVLEVVHAMRDEGLAPNAVTFTTLVKAQGQGGDVIALDRVRALLAQAEASGVRPDRPMYNAFVSAFAKGAAFGEAEDLVVRMSEDTATRPDKVTFASLCFAYFRWSRPYDALDVYHYAVETGAPLDAYFYNGFVDQLVRAELYDDAVRVADDAAERGIDVDRNRFSALFELRNDEEDSPLERFKFWLGIPNTCYNEDWRKPMAPPRSRGNAPGYTQDFSTSFNSSMEPPSSPFFFFMS